MCASVCIYARLCVAVRACLPVHLHGCWSVLMLYVLCVFCAFPVWYFFFFDFVPLCFCFELYAYMYAFVHVCEHAFLHVRMCMYVCM